jgi:hypothetical protein
MPLPGVCPMPGTWPSQLAGRLHGIEESRAVWLVQPEKTRPKRPRSKTRTDLRRMFIELVD